MIVSDLLCKSIDWFLYDIGLRHDQDIDIIEVLIFDEKTHCRKFIHQYIYFRENMKADRNVKFLLIEMSNF